MPRPVRFVVRIHQSGMSFPDLLPVWREADRLGYDGVSLYDLVAAPCLECWTLLATLAAATHQVRPIPLVLANTYRHPAVLAKMATTLDLVSGGRLIMGLGAGGDPRDHRASGLPWEPVARRVARLEDAVCLMRFLWSGQAGPFTSRYYGTVEGPGLPRPTRAQGPPVIVGGHGRRHLLRAVARVADISNIGFDLSVSQWEDTKALLARYAAEAGRQIDSIALGHNATVIIGQEPAAIRAGVSRYAGMRRLTAEAAQQRLTNAVVGDPEHCLARLREYRTAGITWFFLLFPDLPRLDSLQLFARTVLPAFR